MKSQYEIMEQHIPVSLKPFYMYDNKLFTSEEYREKWWGDEGIDGEILAVFRHKNSGTHLFPRKLSFYHYFATNNFIEGEMIEHVRPIEGHDTTIIEESYTDIRKTIHAFLNPLGCLDGESIIMKEKTDWTPSNQIAGAIISSGNRDGIRDGETIEINYIRTGKELEEYEKEREKWNI